MFAELRDYRDLLFLMTHRDFILRYRRAVMGVGWAVFMPVINTIVFTMIFTKMARIETTVPYPLFAFCGLLPWNIFATSLKTSANTLIANKALLAKVYFPREVFPFSTLLVSGRRLPRRAEHRRGDDDLLPDSALCDRPLSSGAARGAADVHGGTAMLLAPANLYYRDVKYILDVLVAVGMFATPVVYPTRHVGGPLGMLLQLNPLAPIIDGYRAVLLRGELPPASVRQRRSSRSACSPSAGWSSTEPNTPLRRTSDMGDWYRLRARVEAILPNGAPYGAA